MSLDFVQPGNLVNFDGLSDFSDVMTNTINTITAIIRNRLTSMINAQILTAPINSVLNKVISSIPDDIEIKGSDYFIEGLLQNNPTTVAGSYISIPLQSSIQSEQFPYPYTCDTLIP